MPAATLAVFRIWEEVTVSSSGRFPYARTFLLGFGFFGISLIWPIFNNFVPVFLKELGLSATLVGFVMTWDNYLNMFIQPAVGTLSDTTWTRWGRRKPWMLIGAPLAAAFFVLVPLQRTVTGIMFAILLTNIGMALFRAPTVALLGDLFPPSQRSRANGVINLMGGLGAIVAFLAGGWLYDAWGRPAPFVMGSVLMLLAVAAVVIRIREPRREAVETDGEAAAGWREHLDALLHRTDPSGVLLLLAILAWFIGYNALETWLSSFGHYALGIPLGTMATYTAVLPLVFVLMALPAGFIGERFGRKRVIMAGVVGLLVLMGYGYFIHSTTTLLLFLALAGAFWALVNVNSLPMVYDVGGSAAIGAFTGLYYLASNIAAVAGPQAVGLIIDITRGDYRSMFLFSLAFMALAILLLVPVRPQSIEA